MIHKKSYTPEWIEAKLKEIGANSYDLGEKMIYAFTLLEQLQLKGLQFIFKGGTCLALMTDKFHRFSKDIDIMMPEEPGNLRKIFDAIVSDSEFTRWEESIRQRDEFQVPKKHFKFYYKESKPTGIPEKPILLDIIFVENTYPKTKKVRIFNALLVTVEPYAEIEIPTFDSITGDKLTAFACNTIGIPVGKKKELEIAKQLFDLNLLYDKIDSHENVGVAFIQTAQMCIKAYRKTCTPEHVYDDILDTAYTMAMNGKYNKILYEEIKRGVTGLGDYLSKGAKFGHDAATLAAAKTAYLAACLLKGRKPEKIKWNKDSHAEFKLKNIEHGKYGSLNKELKKRNAEAWFFWLNTAEILSLETISGDIKKDETVIEVTETIAVIVREGIELLFIVNGKPTLVKNIDTNEILGAAVLQALNQTGNSGRPLEHWIVKLGAVDLDISKKIAEFNFMEDAKIFVSLKSGAGG